VSRPGPALARAAAVLALALAARGAAAATILHTRHNLSATGPGTVKALTETRVCIFCHTPHNANPRTPLWNREVPARTYTLYENPATLSATPQQPLEPSRLCLGCHDGMIALGAVLQPPGGIAMGGAITPGSPAAVGAGGDLSGDHPISIPYADAAALDPAIRPAPGGDLELYGTGTVECTTCHDAHQDRFPSPDKAGTSTGKFLVADNRRSGLCVLCHDLPGWIGSTHQQSAAAVDAGVLPVAPRTWPTWPTLAEWGCEGCHVPHGSRSGPFLLYRATESETCALCHSGAPVGGPHAAAASSRAVPVQTGKISTHPMDGASVRSASLRPRGGPARESGDVGENDVSCADCHNSHAMARTIGGERAPGMAASLRGVSGVDQDGVPVAVAGHEYEICFRCHGDENSRAPLIRRVVSTTNARLQFDTGNPSYHPVVGTGRSAAVPSLVGSARMVFRPTSTIECSDCHSDDGGFPRGPHSSSTPPILRDRYETADLTPESARSYALCYGCHDRASILANASFRRKGARRTASGGGHSGHLEAGAPCSGCHDAHGVPAVPGTGDHARLINFDTAFVRAAPGQAVPRFWRSGDFTGRCTLECHGRVHLDEAYP
jgi:predicted CXXCH cytochrome family protein